MVDRSPLAGELSVLPCRADGLLAGQSIECLPTFLVILLLSFLKTNKKE